MEEHAAAFKADGSLRWPDAVEFERPSPTRFAPFPGWPVFGDVLMQT
jgi:hypothetical protein